MNRISKLSVTILNKKYSQYIDGEKFTCYSAKHKNAFTIDVLISEFLNVSVGDTLDLVGYLRTDFGYKKSLVTKFFAIDAKHSESVPELNEMYVYGQVNKMAGLLPLKSGRLVRQVFLKDNAMNKKHTNVIKVNLVDKAARKSKQLDSGMYIYASGTLGQRKELEITVTDYEEV